MTEAENAPIEAEVMGFAVDHSAAFGALDQDRPTGSQVEENVTSASVAERIDQLVPPRRVRQEMPGITPDSPIMEDLGQACKVGALNQPS